MATRLDHEVIIVTAYVAWLNEAVRIRALMNEAGWPVPLTMESMFGPSARVDLSESVEQKP